MKTSSHINIYTISLGLSLIHLIREHFPAVTTGLGMLQSARKSGTHSNKSDISSRINLHCTLLHTHFI